MATVYRKYVNEGPAGFDLAVLASRLRDFLQPVHEEMGRILDFSDYCNPCCGGRYGHDMNDTETAGFVKRALRLYDAATYTGMKDPERDVAEIRDALIRISNLDDHSAVRVLAVGIAQDVLARIKARAPEGTP